MSDTIPDEFMKAAQDLVAAEQIRFASAYGTVITDSRTVEVIARALMATAHAAGRAEALEDAAKKFEAEDHHWGPTIAQALRALKEKTT